VPSKTVSTPVGAALDPRGRQSRSQSVSLQRRALLLPQEVKELGSERCIVFYEGLRPIRCKKIRYFRDKRFRRRLFPAPSGPIPCRGVSASLPVTPGDSAGASGPPSESSVGDGSTPRAEKEAVVIRDATVEDVERIESLTLEDFAFDFSKVQFPDRDGPLSQGEMKAAVDTFLNSLERA
jgi:type IV secretion system protein VirD4